MRRWILWANRDATSARSLAPVLIVPAPFKRPYIWDLLPAVSVVRRMIERERRTIEGREFVAGLPADKCTRCGETYVRGEALADFEKLVAGTLAQEGPASGEAFRFLRKAISLKAADLAALLGVTPETISRWENGQRAVDVAAWATLAAIVVEELQGQKLTLERLRATKASKRRRVEFGDIATPYGWMAALREIVGAGAVMGSLGASYAALEVRDSAAATSLETGRSKRPGGAAKRVKAKRR